MKGVFGALVFAYAILSHAAVHDGTVVVQGLALATLATVVLIVPLAAGRRWAWASVPVVVAVIYLLITFDAATAVIAYEPRAFAIPDSSLTSVNVPSPLFRKR